MSENISDYITFPKTFEKYRWYKPILVLAIGLIVYLALMLILMGIFSQLLGENLMDSLLSGGYEVLNNDLGLIFNDLTVVLMIPSLYIATKIVKDRPFSSYSSSRGGWNHKLFLKAFIIPFIGFLVSQIIQSAITRTNGIYHFSITFLIISIIFVPLQCIAEEYAYRGLLMQTFGSWFNIPILAIILQSLIFGISHGYNNIGNLEVICFGILMGILAWKSNGIEVTSAFHTGNNLSISLLVMLGIQSSSSTISLNDAIFVLITDIILFLIIYYIGKRSNWFGEIPENSQNA